MIMMKDQVLLMKNGHVKTHYIYAWNTYASKHFDQHSCSIHCLLNQFHTHTSQHIAYLNFVSQKSPLCTILAICAYEHLLRFLVLVSDLSMAQVSKAACCVRGFMLGFWHVAILFWTKSFKLFHMQSRAPKSTGLDCKCTHLEVLHYRQFKCVCVCDWLLTKDDF